MNICGFPYEQLVTRTDFNKRLRLLIRKITQKLRSQSDPWPREVAAHEGAFLLQRQEEGQEEGADRKRNTGSDGGSFIRAVSRTVSCKWSRFVCSTDGWSFGFPASDSSVEDKLRLPETSHFELTHDSFRRFHTELELYENRSLTSSVFSRDASKMASSPPTSPRPGSASGSTTAPASNVVPPRQQKPAASGATRKKVPQKKKKGGKGGW